MYEELSISRYQGTFSVDRLQKTVEKLGQSRHYGRNIPTVRPQIGRILNLLGVKFGPKLCNGPNQTVESATRPFSATSKGSAVLAYNHIGQQLARFKRIPDHSSLERHSEPQTGVDCPRSLPALRRKACCRWHAWPLLPICRPASSVRSNSYWTHEIQGNIR